MLNVGRTTFLLVVGLLFGEDPWKGEEVPRCLLLPALSDKIGKGNIYVRYDKIR